MAPERRRMTWVLAWSRSLDADASRQGSNVMHKGCVLCGSPMARIGSKTSSRYCAPCRAAAWSKYDSRRKAMHDAPCKSCGNPINKDLSASHLCDACIAVRAKMRVNSCSSPNGSRAHYAVRKAVAHGTLPRLDGSVACADCGRRATGYDHRDYLKPLDVNAVCTSCNHRRGSAAHHNRKPPRRTP